MELVLAYAAGMLTLINPCVLPVLPIVLATALNASRFGPVVLAAGMSLSFVAFGMFVSVVGYGLGITEDTVSRIGAILMIAFGAVMLVPQFSSAFATATAGLSARADARVDTLDRSSLQGQFLGGALLGAVWSPCVGPTLGGAIALASAGQSLGWAATIMTAFALGISTVMLALAYGTRRVILQRQEWLRAIALRSRPIMGVTFIVVGLAIYFHFTRTIEAWLLDAMPAWLVDFTVAV